MSTSPVPTKKQTTETMDFFKAFEQIIHGRKIHRLEWADKQFYGFLNGGIVSLHKPDGQNYQWIISDGDLNGTDYIFV